MKPPGQTPRAATGAFWRQTALLFCAQRAADAVALAVSLVVVPRYIGTADLGAVLPLTNIATALALPLYAFAMTVAKEANTLAGDGRAGEIKSLFRGVFAAAGLVLPAAALLAGFVLPAALGRMRVDGATGAVAFAAAILGCAAPVFTGALQALKRFGALALVTALAAPVRLAVLLALMPAFALAGFYAGQGATFLFTMAAALFFLRRDLAVPAAPYWTRGAGRRLAVFFAGMLATLGLPMIADCLQTSLLRVRLAEADSAAYYLLSRFSDLSAYLALPLVLTLFPYTAEQSARGRSTRPFVWRAAAAQIVFGLALAGLSVFFGSDALALLPGGETHAHRAHLIPRLVATATLTSLYVYQTNAAAAAGRWRFLYWIVPLHLGYAAVLAFAVPPAPSLESLVDLFLAFAAVRALFAAADFLFESRGAQARTVPSPETRYL